jgi:hypothetical protein
MSMISGITEPGANGSTPQTRFLAFLSGEMNQPQESLSAVDSWLEIFCCK